MSELKSQQRQFWVILAIVFLGFIGISMPYLIFPALFLNPDYSILAGEWSGASLSLFLGVTLAAYPLGQFIGSPILGAMSDDYGRKKLLTASLLVGAACNLVTGLSIAWQNLALLILSRFIAGLMEGNIAIARAMAADLKLLSKQKTFGKINAVISIAYLLGPFLGALIADNSISEELTASTPFYLVCGLFLLLAVASMIVLQPSLTTVSETKTVWQRINFIKRMSVLFENKQLKSLMIVSTLFTLAVDIFYEFAPVYLTIKWVLVPADLIYYNIGLCLALAFGNAWLPGILSPHIKRRTLILSSLGGFALLLVGVVLTNSMIPMIGLFTLCGLAIGLGVTLVTVKISDSVSDTMQGEVMGTQMSLRVLGDGVICLIGGALLILSSKLILIFASLLSLWAMACYRSVASVKN